jgi:hypothetical protein
MSMLGKQTTSMLELFCLTSSRFAQAWRKQSTMRHTRYMVQCCQLLAQRKEHPSDVLITSMIELSELICRINDYFSYDDIDNTEVNGEIMLKATTLSFRNELDQIRNSIPIEAKNNSKGFSILRLTG